MNPSKSSDGTASSVVDLDAPTIVVSSDGHIGPRLDEQLRAYCPPEHLDDFDAFSAAERERRSSVPKLLRRRPERQLRNLQLEGHHDVQAYLDDMDLDGVAAEVLFHGSQNGEPIPFMPLGAVPSGNPIVNVDFSTIDQRALEMYAIGQSIFNHWLADAVSLAPHRLVGLAHIPFWDPDRAADTVRWAREHGLKGVNLPAPRPGLPDYADECWDVLWAACQETDMPVTTHAGAGDPATWRGPHGNIIAALESAGWPSRRALHFLLFGGVFHRFPGLKLVLTEQPGTWWSATARDYDSAWRAYPSDDPLYGQVPLAPSEYMARNVFMGASFLSAQEAQDAVERGYVSRVMWGRDYPHTEGTFQALESDDDVPQSRLALRDALAGCAPEDAAAMAGRNAVEVYGLDEQALQEVAVRIGAPTVRDLLVPLEEIPESHGVMVFRKFGTYS